MAKRRRAVPVVLTDEQRKRLENLWFVYGNYGPKTTKGNHSFIQGLLERGEDERPLRMRGYIPTPECEQAVEEILGSDKTTQTQIEQKENSEDQKTGKGRLQIVPTEAKKPLSIDPEMKAIIDEMKPDWRERKQVAANEPDAAA